MPSMTIKYVVEGLHHVMKQAAFRWTFSNCVVSFCVCGFQAADEYSSLGRTSDM